MTGPHTFPHCREHQRPGDELTGLHGARRELLSLALKDWTRDRNPHYWAMAQHNLGRALWALGSRESGVERLEEAVAAHRAALEEINARAGAACLGGDSDGPR